MKLTFSWEKISDEISPFCESSVKNKDDISLLACLLMDDGGRNYLKTVSWVEDEISMLDALAQGNVLEKNLDREAWGIQIKGNEVKIYSLLDEDYKELISAPIFRLALLAWKDFIQSKPDIEIKKEIFL